MPNTVVRKIYLYDDISTTLVDVGNGEWRDRPSDTAGALCVLGSLPKEIDEEPNAYLPVDNGEAHVILFTPVETPDYVAGLFGKKRVDGLPLLENSGTLYRLPIGDGGGVFEGSHFIYFKAQRQLLMEVNQYAPRRSMLQKYIEAKEGQAPGIDIVNAFFKPVASAGALAAYRRVSQNTVGAEIVFERDLVAGASYDGRLGDVLMPLADEFENVPRIGIQLHGEKYGRLEHYDDIGEIVIGLVEEQPETLSSLVAYARVSQGAHTRKVRFNLLSEDFGHPVHVPMTNRVIDSEAMWQLMLERYPDIVRDSSSAGESPTVVADTTGGVVD